MSGEKIPKPIARHIKILQCPRDEMILKGFQTEKQSFDKRIRIALASKVLSVTLDVTI